MLTSDCRRILLLTPCWPCGQAFGGALRTRHVARALAELGELAIEVVGSDADDEKASAATRLEFQTGQPIPAVAQPRHGLSDRIRWAVDPAYFNLHGVVASPEDRGRVLAALDDYDVVWVQNARTPNVLQIHRWAHTHLDIDDVPSLSEACATSARSRLKARARQLFLRRRERHYRRRFTTLSVCSEADRRYLGLPGVHVIPNGFATPPSAPVRNLHPDQPRIGFIGLYSHRPNFEGVRWFLRGAWPAIRAAVPGIRFRLLGRDTDGDFRPEEPNVDTLGWVADPSGEIATWSAMVVPIRSGGGTRIKIADGFSRKCPIVSTRHGAYGYDVEDRKQLRLVDDPVAFAEACVELIRQPAIGTALAECAWQDYIAKWTWDAITPRIHAAAEDCLRRSRDAVSSVTLQV